jgi:hypothetical protein
LGALATSRAVVVILGAALVWVGVAFAGYALMLAMVPTLGAAESAAATAGILVVGPGLYVGIAALRAGPAAREEPTPEAVTLQLLAAVARDRPLLAVLGAGLFGAADVLWRKRR